MSTTSTQQTGRTERLTVGHDEVVFRLSSEENPEGLLAMDVRIPAGGGPPMLHRHLPAELYRLDDGELAFYVATESGDVNRTIATAGEVIHIPGGREHTIRNESGREAAAFVVFAPGGSMEQFIRAAAAAGEDTGPAEVIAIAGQHGIEMTRPL